MRKYQVLFTYVLDGHIAVDVVELNARNIYAVSEKFFSWIENKRGIAQKDLRKVYFDRIKEEK